MAASRNERRKAAQARLLAKNERFLARVEACRVQTIKAVVRENMSNRKPERNYYPQSCLANMQGSSHRAYICRASGAMSKRSADALKAKGAW